MFYVVVWLRSQLGSLKKLPYLGIILTEMGTKMNHVLGIGIPRFKVSCINIDIVLVCSLNSSWGLIDDIGQGGAIGSWGGRKVT